MGKQWTVADFIFWGSKITSDHDCRHEIKRNLLLGRKAVTNLDSTLKNKEITANKCPYNQSYVWIVMYGYESWALKKAKH